MQVVISSYLKEQAFILTSGLKNINQRKSFRNIHSAGVYVSP